MFILNANKVIHYNKSTLSKLLQLLLASTPFASQEVIFRVSPSLVTFGPSQYNMKKISINLKFKEIQAFETYIRKSFFF